MRGSEQRETRGYQGVGWAVPLNVKVNTECLKWDLWSRDAAEALLGIVRDRDKAASPRGLPPSSNPAFVFPEPPVPTSAWALRMPIIPSCTPLPRH